ncbi:HAMP domain-containing sensor histidine kinase [Phaeobacter gallaeciensis]|uniref:HAMP domain-containing sensor histidine kinase n=1 Tax=Phaeobacter gallaeciensis TaxID=60890 RepID=UPI00237F1212|nr:HAMP domain-containing sensor histidine kinase [Phaeobacter gallaeciensis]MDE4063181.1 HAMP domain-containing sensor histidine kinase [Phaeobacter gallaeciensis]MDE4126181.1 HAMP domain-containing sensor histidine kinase [Phaeobacter gallaeciensis]MDE4130647.1 HAMP domain-containing sensor histidine kinase [Phaeobacter gallaeciensis]
MDKTPLLRRLRRSTSVRLSLRFALLYSLLAALVFAAAYKMAGYETTKWIKEQLVEQEAVFAEAYSQGGREAVVAQLATYGAFNFEDHRVYLLVDAQGRSLAGNVKSIASDRAPGYVDASAIEFVTSSRNEGFGYILREVKLGTDTLVMGASTYFLAELLEGLGEGLLAGFVFMLMVGVGVVVGRRTEHRLRQVTATLDDVAQGDLEARVPLGGEDTDDLARLSSEINKTLGQLQKLVESQKQISADIAHDLRTPMQRLRQRLEVIGQSQELPGPLANDVYEAIDAADDLIETFHALLRISQIEAGARQENFSQVDLIAVLDRIEDAYGVVAEEKQQTLEFTAGPKPLNVFGDQQLLTQMMANVIENALRHCPPTARIEVTLSARNKRVVFTVCDNGKGISEHEREKVFRRFYRLEKSRTTPGNGLGLSLVKAVTDLHGAVISLSGNSPGLCVTVIFPKSVEGVS